MQATTDRTNPFATQETWTTATTDEIQIPEGDQPAPWASLPDGDQVVRTSADADDSPTAA